MGVGNYTEQDVYEGSRAFTGWTLTAKMPRWPYGRLSLALRVQARGPRLQREELPGPHGAASTARTLSTSSSDSPHAPGSSPDTSTTSSWPTNPRCPPGTSSLPQTPRPSGSWPRPSSRPAMKSNRCCAPSSTQTSSRRRLYKKVKSPVEVVVGTLRLTGDMQGPDPRLDTMAKVPGYMGQDILDPPSVEGWHTGEEWINSGALVERVNFVGRLCRQHRFSGRPGHDQEGSFQRRYHDRRGPGGPLSRPDGAS